MKKKEDFTRIFQEYMLILVVPLIVIGIAVLVILLGSVSEGSKSLNEKIIDQYVDSADNEMSQVLNISSSVINSYATDEFLSVTHSEKKDLNHYAKMSIDELNQHLMGNDIVKHIALYSTKNDVIVNESTLLRTDEFYNSVIANMGISEETFKDMLYSYKTTYFFVKSETEVTSNVIFCRPINVNSNQLGLFFAVIDRNEFVLRVIGNSNESKIEFALLGKDYDYIIKTDGCSEELINYARQNRKTSEYSFKNYNVIVKTSNKMGNSYVCYIDINTYTGNVMSLSTLFCILFIIVLLMSVLVARKKTSIIKGHFSNAKKDNILLSNKLEEYISIISKRNMANMLQNNFDIWGNAIRYDFNFSCRNYCVTVVNIITEEPEVPLDSGQTGYAIKYFNDDVLKKLNENKIVCDYVEMAKDVYAYVLNYDDEKLFSIIGSLFEETIKTYNLSAYVGIGDNITDTTKIRISYENAVFALKKCMDKNEPGIVYYKDLQLEQSRKIRYSSEKEKNLLRAIKLGLCDVVDNIFNEIITDNHEQDGQELPRGIVFVVVSTIYEAVEEAYGENTKKMQEYERIVKNIMSMDTESALGVLREISNDIARDNQEQSKHNELSEKIIKYIDEMYMQSDFSLSMLAEKLDMNYSYLSRVFTEYFGVNFVSYVTNKRLDAAKELLLNSDYSVNEISERVGFIRSSAFINMFKKYNGITPGQYRKNNE